MKARGHGGFVPTRKAYAALAGFEAFGADALKFVGQKSFKPEGADGVIEVGHVFCGSLCRAGESERSRSGRCQMNENGKRFIVEEPMRARHRGGRRGARVPEADVDESTIGQGKGFLPTSK